MRSILTLIIGIVLDKYIKRSLHLGSFPKSVMTKAANIQFEIKIIEELDIIFKNKNEKKYTQICYKNANISFSYAFASYIQTWQQMRPVVTQTVKLII